MRGIELSEQAQLRLKEITDYYLLHESLQRTIKVLTSFDEAFEIIRNNPHNYKRYTSTKFINLDIRIFSHFKTFHIYFIIYPERIQIA